MIPLRDSVRPRRRPWVSYVIIAANLLVFAYQLTLTRLQLTHFAAQYGMVPARFWAGLFGGAGGPGPFGGAAAGLALTLAPLFTSQFIHGGWLHLGGNMLYLWVFGDNVEDRLGHLGYVVFYLLAGAAANVAHAAAGTGSLLPAVGASGAIAGVLGAYLVAFPRARVLTLVPLGPFLRVIEVPAVLLLALWFLLQLLNGVAGLGMTGGAGVAWWAHIGGFLAGVVVMMFLSRRAGR